MLEPHQCLVVSEVHLLFYCSGKTLHSAYIFLRPIIQDMSIQHQD